MTAVLRRRGKRIPVEESDLAVDETGTGTSFELKWSGPYALLQAHADLRLARCREEGIKGSLQLHATGDTCVRLACGLSYHVRIS